MFLKLYITLYKHMVLKTVTSVAPNFQPHLYPCDRSSMCLLFTIGCPFFTIMYGLKWNNNTDQREIMLNNKLVTFTISLLHHHHM